MPSNSETTHLNRAKKYLSKGDKENAKRYLKLSIKSSQTKIEANLLLSSIYLEENNYKKAEDILHHSLALIPNDPSLSIALVNAYISQEKVVNAEKLTLNLISKFGRQKPFLLNLAVIYLLLNRETESDLIFKELRSQIENIAHVAAVYLSYISPNYISDIKKYFIGSASSLLKSNGIIKISAFLKGIHSTNINSQCRIVTFYLNIKNHLTLNERILFLSSIKLTGACSSTLMTELGIAQKLSNDLPAAKSSLENALQVERSQTALIHLSDVLYFLGDVSKSKEMLSDELTDQIYTHALMLKFIERGDFNSAWRSYNSWQEHAINTLPSPSLKKEYVSEDPKKVLIFKDQGIGDQIMFLRCLPRFIQLNQNVSITLLLDERLYPLVKLPKGVSLLQPEDLNTKFNIDEFDSCFRASKLPSLCIKSKKDFNFDCPTLEPSNTASTEVRSSLRMLGKKPKIGFAWKGGNDPLMQEIKRHTLADFAPLLSIPEVTWINLQHGNNLDEIRSFTEVYGIDIYTIDNIDPVKDFEKHAALISELDYVVQISNTSIHIAGALGVKATCLLPPNHDFRWFQFDGDDASPWYPSVKLLKREERRSWSDFLHSVKQQLLGEINHD